MYSRLIVPSKSKIVREVLGAIFLPKEYNFEEDTKNGYWCFKKREGDIIKKVYVQENRGRSHLKLVLEMNTVKPRVEILDLVPNGNFDYRGLPYEGMDGFKNTLLKLKEILIQYGLPKLKEMENVKILTFSKEIVFYTMKNAQSIWERKMLSWKFGELNSEAQISLLSDLIESEKEKEFPDAEKQLADISAVFGEMMLHKWKGVWQWNDYTNLPIIIIKHSHKLSAIGQPYLAVLKQWKGEMKIEREWRNIQTRLNTKNRTIEPWQWIK